MPPSSTWRAENDVTVGRGADCRRGLHSDLKVERAIWDFRITYLSEMVIYEMRSKLTVVYYVVRRHTTHH